MQSNKKKENNNSMSLKDSYSNTELDNYDSDIENEFNNIKNTGNTTMKTSNNIKPNSPKPIPKGVDFGEDLLGNPKFFPKNNQGNSSGNLFLANSNNTNQNSPSIENKERNPFFGKPVNNNIGQWTKLEPPLSEDFDEDDDDENLSETKYSKDEIISNEYSETDKKSLSSSGMNKKYRMNQNVPHYNDRMNANISFNKYQDMTEYEIFSRKEEILLELEKLEEKGVRLEKKYNIQNDLYEMERTYMRLKNKKDQTAAMKLMKKVLMGLVSGTEYVNQKFNSNNIDLEGWSENVLLNIADYDEIFEELYDKYKSKFAVAPEIKLFLTLIGSAFTFHMSKVLASKFSTDNFNFSSAFNNSKNTFAPQANNYPTNSFTPSNNTPNNNNTTNMKQNTNNNTNSTNNSNINNNINMNNSQSNNVKKQLPNSKVLASLFDTNSKKTKNKNNDDLDEIIKEMEDQYSSNKKSNKLGIPDENDYGFNEILQDDDENDRDDESFQLNEIQESINI